MRSNDAGGGGSGAELVARLAELAAELAAHPPPESGAACYEQAELLGRAVDVIESAIAARVGVATRSGQVAEWGHTSPTAWLRTSLAMRHARAEDRAVLAAQLPRLPQVAKRLAAGELSAGYATAIAAGVRRLDAADCEKAEDLLLGFVDDGHSVAQITRFADKIKDLIADRDDTNPEPEDGRRAERQWWALHRSASGTFVKGHFGQELTALLKTKLEPLAQPCGAEDTRDHAERLADALQAFLAEGDSRWDPILLVDLKQPAWIPPSGQAAIRADPTTMSAPTGVRTRSVTADDPPGQRESAAADPNAEPAPALAWRPSVPVPDRTSQQPAADSLGRHESPSGGAATSEPKPPPARRPPRSAHDSAAPERPQAGAVEATAEDQSRQADDTPRTDATELDSAMRWVPRPPAPTWPFDGTPYTARLTDGTPVPMRRARSILMNAGFSTLILGTDGHPLYLGRRVRCATPAQRRALHARYPTCVVDSCEIPATGCQIDHVDGWENGQPTDIDRLVMCCGWHNRYKWRHPDRITITQHPDGRYRYQIVRPTPRQHADGPGPSSGRGP